MGYVLDCSYCISLLIEEDQSLWARATIAGLGAELWVPGLWAAEVSSAVLNACRRKRITEQDRDAALQEATDLRLQLDAQIHNPVELGVLALRHGLTAYDAVYFELAQRRKLTLVSLDSALLTAAQNAGLKILTAP